MDNEFTVHEFSIDSNDPLGRPGPWNMASVVTTAEDFEALLDQMQSKMQDVRVINSDDEFDQQIARLRSARHIPLIARGRKTEWVFERFQVEQDFMSVIVRGEGQRLASQVFGQMVSRNVGQA